MVQMSLSMLFLAARLMQNPTLQVDWQKYTDTTFHVSFECPATAQVVHARDIEGLYVHVHCPDSLRPTIWALGEKTILTAAIAVTTMPFEDAAKGWGLYGGGSSWSVHANPGMGPALPLRRINGRGVITLEGFQSWGQTSFGDVEGYAEVARVPYKFIFVEGHHGNNITIEVLYDPMAGDILKRIISSIRVLE